MEFLPLKSIRYNIFVGWDIHLMTYFLYTQYEIINETLDYKAIDFLSDFGGHLG